MLLIYQVPHMRMSNGSTDHFETYTCIQCLLGTENILTFLGDILKAFNQYAEGVPAYICFVLRRGRWGGAENHHIKYLSFIFVCFIRAIAVSIVVTHHGWEIGFYIHLRNRRRKMHIITSEFFS